MSASEPWLANWAITSPKGGGGQGTTFVVSSIINGATGILKILKHQSNEEARRRMSREVLNLKILHAAGCKVPQVIDGNTDQFEAKDMPLYFVMEVIAGEQLREVVQKNGSLSFDKSIALTQDLCATVAQALKEDVLHRDLKPENIVVRDLAKNDLVVVDYGLSFNQSDDGNLTHGSETLDNKFCSLPERRVPGGNRRDPRSELTSVCAILYYCLTGKPPVDLVGPDGRPPHRRPGSSVREKLGNKPETPRLELFFDRGFASNIDARFQNTEELVSRLQDVLTPAVRMAAEDPQVIAVRVRDLLLKNNREVQMAAYKSNNLPFSATLSSFLNGTMSKVQPFTLAPTNLASMGLTPDVLTIPDIEPLGFTFLSRLGIRESLLKFIFMYQVCVKGPQCGVFRSIYRKDSQSEKPVAAKPWEALIWYDGLEKPDYSLVVQDFKACVVEAMQKIEEDLRTGGA